MFVLLFEDLYVLLMNVDDVIVVELFDFIDELFDFIDVSRVFYGYAARFWRAFANRVRDVFIEFIVVVVVIKCEGWIGGLI